MAKAKKSSQDQSAPSTTHMTDYEKIKLLRVQENQERLKELGIKKIASSLTSLVDSQKTKKTKKKSAFDTDIDGNHFHGETGEDYHEVSASVGAAKKQHRPQQHRPQQHRSQEHRPQFIAPLSMNKYANLAKQRIVAPNVSRVLPLEEGCEGHETFVDSNAAKKSRLQQCKEANEQKRQSIDTNATKKNQTRGKVTMGELLLNRQGSQTQKSVLKQNATKPNSAQTSILSRSRLQLFDEDDVIPQDLNERDREELGFEDDENEDVEDDLRLNDGNVDDREYEDDENENIEDDLSLHDVNEVDREYDEDENMEDFETNNNETESDGSEDEFENEDAELELVQDPQSQKGSAISTTKKRGPTMMHNIHTREFDKREVIICNELKQPIGPSENDVVGKFSRFLGTIARTYSYCPLTYSTWHKVPDKHRMWEYVLEKYIVPEEAKSHVLQSIGALWRGHKSRLKKKHFYDLKDNATRLKQRPKCIPEKDFLKLLRLWNTKEDQKRCLIAKKRRMSQKNMHTAGPKSFARIREDMKNEDPNKEPPSLTKMFERTRERKEGHVYADTYEETGKLIEQMKNYNVVDEGESGENGSASVDPFLAVMNKEYNGHRRLFGRGVTNKLLKKVNGSATSYMVPGELMESVRTDIDTELNRLVEMRKQIEDDHERKKLEIAEEHKRNKAELEDMRKEIENQRDKLVEDAVKKVIQKLPRRVVREFLT